MVIGVFHEKVVKICLGVENYLLNKVNIDLYNRIYILYIP